MADRMKKMQIEIRKIAVAALALLMIATVAGFFSGVVPLLDWFADFRMVYVVVAVGPLALLARHDRRAVVAALAVMAINAAMLLPWAPIHGTDEACRPDEVVLSINAFGNHSDHDALVEKIEAENPDILFVCELTPELGARIAAIYPHHVWDEETPSLGVFSKHPITESQKHYSPSQVPYIDAIVATSNGALRVLGAHPSAPFSSKNSADRNATLIHLAELARASEEPVLLLGDLNVTMFSPHYQALADAGLQNVRHGRGVHATWPAFSPLRIPIDHVVHSDDLAVCDVEVGESFGSDHLPLRASLTWRPQELVVAAR